MANAIYPKYMEAVIQASSGSSLAGTLKAVLIDTADYTYNAAHDFYDDVSAGAVGTPQTIGSKTYTNGLLDGADVTFTAVTGDQSEAVILFLDTGTPSTSRLVAYLDTGVTGLPVTPNGGDITITWNAGGIIQF
jgi:hypothetical protein